MHDVTPIGRGGPLIAISPVPDRRGEPVTPARQRLVAQVRPADLRVETVATMFEPADPARGRGRLRGIVRAVIEVDE